MKSWYEKHLKKKHGEESAMEAIVEQIEESGKPLNQKLDEMYEAVRNFNKSLQNLEETKQSVDFNVNARYILLVGRSDLHYGNENVDMDYVDRLLNFIENTPNVYCFLNGDVLDNWVMLAPQGGIYEQTLKPERQLDIMIHKLRPIKDKVLALCYGNHEGRSQKQGDKNPSKIMAEQLDVAYLGAGGRLNLNFGDLVYKIHIRHRFRYESSFNPTHACNRLIEQLDSEAQIVFLGHKHEPAIATHFKAGRQRSLLRFGSAMPSTNYSNYLGFGESPLVAPSVILSGEEHLHHPFLSLRVAKAYLNRIC